MTHSMTVLPHDDTINRVIAEAKALTDADDVYADGVYSTLRWLFQGGPTPDFSVDRSDIVRQANDPMPTYRRDPTELARLLRKAGAGDQSATEAYLKGRGRG